jgi:hypothetical protein
MNTIRQLARWLLLSVILPFCTDVLAEPALFTIKPLTRAEWQFPILEGGNPNAAERINALLLINTFTLELPAVPPADPGKSLDVLSEEESRSIPYLSFQVLRNDARIFSVLLDGESCGAYCERFQRPLAFEAGTGRLLTGEDLFTDAGRQALTAEIVKRNQKAIQDHIEKIRDKGVSGFGSQEDFNAALEMYQNCLENWRSKEWQQWPGNMEIHPSEVLFVHGRCSNHVMQGLDDLGDLRNSFAYATLKPWLSDYGLGLLLGEKTAARPGSPLGQWLKGTIGNNIRITLYLSKPFHDSVGTDISGYYFYDKYRKPLKLQGKQKEGRLMLEEYDRKAAPQAVMALENDGKGGLQGQWKNREGKKILPVKLDP